MIYIKNYYTWAAVEYYLLHYVLKQYAIQKRRKKDQISNKELDYLGGGKGVTSAWPPLGNFLEGQAHPNLHRTRFCYFFYVKFFVFAFRWFFTEVVMFIFE